MRIVAAILLASSPAVADADLRLGVAGTVTSQRDSLESGTSTTPGPGASIDVMLHREGWVAGVHAGWASSWNTYTEFSTGNGTRDVYDQLFEGHLLVEWHGGRVAIGGGIGLDVLQSNGTYSLASNGDPTHTDEGLGIRLQAAVDVASFGDSAIALTAGAGLFSLLQASGACGGDLSCADQATTVSIGVAFHTRVGRF